MSQQELYILDFFDDMKPIVKRLYILHCSVDKIKFFSDCIFNIVRGHIQMTVSASRKKLEKHKQMIETLCNKKVAIVRKRQTLSSKQGLKLLGLITINFHSFTKKTWS